MNKSGISNTNIFLFFISALILQLTSFFPRKILTSENSSLNHLLFNNLIYFRTKIINKMRERELRRALCYFHGELDFFCVCVCIHTFSF